jgi:HEAT repeat protein
LDDPNPAVRVAALRAFGWNGNVALSTRALQDEDADVRLVAAMYLPSRKENAELSVKPLIALLKDKHEGVRRAAIEKLSAIGAPAVPALLEALADPDPRVRAGAVEGLGDVGRWKDERHRSQQELAQVIPSLEKLKKDEDSEVRRQAKRILRYLHGQSPDDE